MTISLDGRFKLRSGRGAPAVPGTLDTSPLTLAFAPGAVRIEPLGVDLDDRRLDVIPEETSGVALMMEDGTWRTFPGILRFVLNDDGSGRVINLVDVEDYLPGVVASEMPSWFHREAFRAQAIAARTYAWHQARAAGQGSDWDLTATEASQVYAGLERAAEVPRAAEAVRDTAGVVCTWPSPQGQRIFCTYYSSTCGGSNQAAGAVKNEPVIAPLKGDVKCDYCRDSPTYRWGAVAVPKAEITRRLRQRYPAFEAIGPIDRIEVLAETPDGRPVRLALLDAEGASIELEAENFRLAVDPTGRKLKSTFFRVVVEEEDIVFTAGRGFGHGLGMCQYGASELARRGWTAGRILRYYYPSSSLSRAY